MYLFRGDAPFVERDVMAGIRALLNGSKESPPAGPLGARTSGGFITPEDVADMASSGPMNRRINTN